MPENGFGKYRKFARFLTRAEIIAHSHLIKYVEYTSVPTLPKQNTLLSQLQTLIG